MKKFGSLALVLCMCLAFLMGCSSNTENSSAESSVSSDTETSENSESVDITESKTDVKKLPDGTVKDSIDAQAAKLVDGTVEVEVLTSDKIGDYLDICVYLNFAGYENEAAVSEEFVSFAENACKGFETNFGYASADYTLYVDEKYVASFDASFENGHFIFPEKAIVLDEAYQMVNSEIKQSSYFKSADEDANANNLIENLANPYGSGFPANPSYYPPEKYGQPITTGDFGKALKKLNDDLSVDNGQEVYAYMPPDSDYLEVHFSPSDKAIEEEDDQTVALEYAAMAQLIAENYPDYSDTYGDTITIYLGDSIALISVTYTGSSPHTAFTAFSQDESLNAYLQLAYDTTLGKYDISLLID